MEKSGILKYQDNPHHKKAKLVTMTPKVEKIFRLLDEKQIPWANSCSSGITALDLEMALDVLRKMGRKLEP